MKNALRVAHFSKSWLPQTQTWLHTQIRHLPPTISTSVFCEQLENLDQFDHADTYLRNSAPALLQQLEQHVGHVLRIRRTNYFGNIARQLGTHILHSHFGNVGWENIRLASENALKHVVTFYGYDVNQLPASDKRWYQRYATLFETANLFLCEGPHMAACLEQLGCPEHKLRVHHLGASVEQIEYKERSWKADRPLKLMMASSFVEKKGIPYALAALRDLKPELDFELTIIGDASHETNSRNEKHKILSAIEAYGLDACTTLLGYQSHQALLKTAYDHHIFIAPSVSASTGDTEGGAPVVLIEMAASGMLIISTSHCDIPNIILDEKTGLLAAERDSEGLAARIEWLASNTDQWQRLTRAARAHVTEQFNAEKQALKLAHLYQEL